MSRLIQNSTRLEGLTIGLLLAAVLAGFALFHRIIATTQLSQSMNRLNMTNHGNIEEFAASSTNQTNGEPSVAWLMTYPNSVRTQTSIESTTAYEFFGSSLDDIHRALPTP